MCAVSISLEFIVSLLDAHLSVHISQNSSTFSSLSSLLRFLSESFPRLLDSCINQKAVLDPLDFSFELPLGITRGSLGMGEYLEQSAERVRVSSPNLQKVIVHQMLRLACLAPFAHTLTAELSSTFAPLVKNLSDSFLNSVSRLASSSTEMHSFVFRLYFTQPNEWLAPHRHFSGRLLRILFRATAASQTHNISGSALSGVFTIYYLDYLFILTFFIFFT